MKKILPLEESKEKARKPKRLIGLGIFTAVILAILTAATLYFQNIKDSYIKDTKKINQTYLWLSENAAAIEETKKQRADYYKRRYYLDFPLKYSYSAANFVRRLSLIATKEIELIEIEINPAVESLTFLLKGRIKADNNIETRAKFMEFFRELKQFEDILHIESSKVKVNPGEIKPGMPQKRTSNQSVPGQKKVELYFTIKGEVDTWIHGDMVT
ncbi:MAG: hypothetical protein JSV88_29305 [Candidatus Aminicenantes bacterium]|nr:MAG: hypothetical protein JSV88_29305 [Candidatus Aminicenantes bacterium]